MTDGQRYAAGVDHEEGLKHDSTICWVCAAIAQAVEVERKRLFSKIASMDYKSIKGEKWLLIVRNDALAILEADK